MTSGVCFLCKQASNFNNHLPGQTEMLRAFTSILIFILIGRFSLAQSFDEKDFTRYTKLEGLSHNSITGIVQDSSGYIWIGTRKGLNRFDGRSFNNFFKSFENSPLPEDAILHLTIQDNEIIGSTDAGAFSYNSTSRETKSFKVPSDSIIYFWTNQVWQTLKENRGNYVLSSKTGLYIFNGDGKLVNRYDHYAPQDAGRRELWFGNWLARLSDGRIFQENNLSGSFYNPQSRKIESHFFANHPNLRRLVNGRIDENRISFYGGYDQLLSPNFETSALESYNLVTGQYSSYAIPKTVITDLDWSSKLFFVNDSVAALTSKVGGFYLLHLSRSKNSISCNGQRFFSGRFCTSVFSDREGRLWIGTNDGLYKQNLRNPFFRADDLSDQFPAIITTGIQSVFTANGKVYVGLRNEGGLLILDNKTKKLEQVVDLGIHGPGSNSVNFIFQFNKDTLWLGTARGILWLNVKDHSNGHLDIPGQPGWMYRTKTRNYLEDSEGDLWLSFGQLNSLLLYKRSEHRFYDLSKSPLLKVTFCFSMLEDKNKNVWIAGDGLCRWNRKKNLIDTLIPFPAASKSLVNYMQLLDCDNENNLWINSYDNEIIQYDCNRDEMHLRLPENSMVDGHSITNTGIIDGRIWLGMGNGISAFNVKDFTISQFNYSDGLPSAAITSPRKGSFYSAAENRFYFGANHYLISFIPDFKLIKRTQPIFSVELSVPNTKHSEKISLPYGQNDVEIRLNAINFTDPEENRFAYRLMDEKDTGWRELATKNVVVLSELSSGNHNIELKLYSVNNRWPEQLQKLDIFIRPPFWKTIWFYLLLAVLLLSIIMITYRYRIGQVNRKANIDRLLAKTEMQALHAQMNPHFIFNCLNSIREMILHNETQQASHYLSKFAQLIRITLNQSSKQFISLENTIDYLQRYAEMEKIRNNKFDYKIEVDKELETDEVTIPPMLIQPFVENAIWHGSIPGKRLQIDIRFKKEGHRLVCCVEDNGPGIEATSNGKKDADHHSIGIANVSERIQVLNDKYKLRCELRIEDRSKIGNGTGTIVKLYFPLQSTLS